jgi:hypothetical protein
MWQVWKGGQLIKDGFETDVAALTWACKWLKSHYEVKFNGQR